MNPLQQLHDYGQSLWLDYIRRHLIESGGLQSLISEDDLRGMTSNPSIFEKALSGSTDYDASLATAEQQNDVDAMTLYESFAIPDIQAAADVLRPVYESSNKRDGYVSLEVSPYLAHETETTIADARRLWKAVGRENVMIKIPGTPEGAPAIKLAISEGINVNVTLLFSQDAYVKVAEAFVEGLEEFDKSGGDVSKVASVASFFVSRIDTAIDAILQAKIKNSTDPAEQEKLKAVLGKAAIANAKLAYEKYKQIIGTARWQALAAKGAQTQRLLWASTSVKNPAYRDVLYVEELIGADTVNTMPLATMDAFRDHGKLRNAIENNVDGARADLENLAAVGVSLDEITDKLLVDAVKLFSNDFDKLLGAVEVKREATLGTEFDRLTYALPEPIKTEVATSLAAWQSDGKVRKLWKRDASLWTNTDEAKWLDWLTIVENQQEDIDAFEAIANDVKSSGFTSAVLLGMGGSSLCPEVLAITFNNAPGFPPLHILDSTDPAQIATLESKIDVAKTLFIVSSKSGSTLEPNIYKDYFFGKVVEAVGREAAGSHFIAITDPGSGLEKVATEDKFRDIYYGVPGIGGRYSALSNFGMVPAAALGLDMDRFLSMTEQMVHACAWCVPADKNPGVTLGTILGVCGTHGKDKVTIVASPGISDLGAWLEQLIAESTGKDGKGLIPVDREPLGAPEVYGDDRVFAYVRWEPAADPAQDDAVNALEKAGYPVVRIAISNLYDLGQEFFRWEIATAVAGSFIGINAFNQPDVEASKIETRKLTSQYEESGSLPDETPILEVDGIKLYSDEANALQIAAAAKGDKSLAGYLSAHLARLKPGDYAALLAYVERNDAHSDLLQEMRLEIRDEKHVATVVGFGPRFLHSTGQAYKGGPNSGVFLQITADDAHDLAIPGHKFTFSVVKAAQARGDFAVLAERDRRALRVHLGSDVAAGLVTLNTVLKEVLATQDLALAGAA